MTLTPYPGPGSGARPAAVHAGVPPVVPPVDLQSLDGDQAQGLMRFLEAAPTVHRRHQFFVWTQSQLQPLLPHQLMVCGAWQRERRAVVFDAFHSVVLPRAALDSFADADGPLASALATHWVDGRGRSRAVELIRLGEAARRAAEPLQQALRDSHLLVHGVARPQRPKEIESLFVFGGLGIPAAMDESTLARRGAWLDLVMPFLHSTWLRVVATEQDLQRPAVQAATALAGKQRDADAARASVTERERQILAWVQDGKSNQQIAEVLGISPLTVKNHVQKILRKLGASNRAQAVSLAIALGALAAPQRLSDADER